MVAREIMPVTIFGKETKLGRGTVVFVHDRHSPALSEVERLKSILDRVEKDQANFLAITPIDTTPESAFLEKLIIDQPVPGTKTIIRRPPLFGTEITLKDSGILGQYLATLNSDNVIRIQGEGLIKRPYLLVDDLILAIENIVEASGKDKTTKVYNLYPEEVLTELELAYLIRSIAGEQAVKIEFTTIKVEKTDEIVRPKDNLWPLKATPLREGLSKLIKSLKNKSQDSPPQKEVVTVVKNRLTTLPVTSIITPSKAPKSSPPSQFVKLASLAVLASMGYLFIWPISQVAYHGWLGKKALSQTIANLASANFNEAITSAANGQAHFEKALAYSGKLPGLAAFNQSAKYLNGGLLVSEAAGNVLGVSTEFTSGQLSDKERLSQATSQVMAAFDKLILAGLTLKDINNPQVQELNEYLPTLTALKNVAEVASPLLGFDKPKNYLVLFQNPMERRATGGFIGSYAKVTIDKGVPSSLTFDDIYNPDGQLDEMGLTAPVPPEMAAAIPNMKKLYIRDANWWVSFPNSAKTVANLYQAATGEVINGVIAIDLFPVKELLKLTGPIYLGSFNETVTSSNLYEKTEYQSEANYFEGSPQKKNWLKLLGNKLIEAIGNLPLESKMKIGPLLLTSLKEKHLQIATFDELTSQTLAENGWDGRVGVTDPESDFLMVVDSNIGGNKANYYVKRSVNYEVKNTYREGTLEGFLTVNYHNTSLSGSWPDGTYQNYLRVLVPPETFLNEATLQQTDNVGETNSPKVLVGSESGFRTFAVPLTVFPGQTTTLKLHYTLPSTCNLQKGATTYKLKVVKQAGVESEPFDFKFQTPFGRTVSLPANFKSETSGVSYSTLQNNDLDLQIPIN